MAGFKDFQPAEVLTAADVNDFLMDQSVMVFDDAAARAAAIGTANFTEGMTTYNKDTAQLELFDGAAFVAVGAQPGLIHIKRETFAAANSVIFNDVFSASFSNYRIISATTASAQINLFLRVRVAGADNTTSNSYVTQNLTADATTVSASRGGDTVFIMSDSFTSLVSIASVDFFNPFLTSATGMSSFGGRATSGAVTRILYGTHNVLSSFTGFSVIPSSGNISGTIDVYGYSKG